jgi:hypothetical protein
MRADGEQFVAVLKPDQRGLGWVAPLTHRIGFRGNSVVRAATEEELRIRLRKMDKSVLFFNKGGGWV